MCVSFIIRRLQPLLGEKNPKDQSYTAYFRPDKRELNELYREIECARDFLWCIDMIYESKLPAMNINSISLAPHAADRAAENQDRRKWVSWMKEIEKKAEKDVMIEFFQNKYCTMHEIERELEKYPEDFVVGEEPTWWVMGSSKTEPPRKTERQQKSASSSGQRSQTAGGSVPQQGAPSGGSQASDAVKIDNEIIDSIFRMNSGGEDDRWVIINPINCWTRYLHLIRRGYYFERCDCQCEVQHRQQYRVPNHTNCIWAVPCRRQERNILGVHAEMPDLFAIALRGKDQRGKDYSFLCWEGECGMATAICFRAPLVRRRFAT